jgi:hypothetical protein
MLHAGPDLRRRKVDVCLVSGAGGIVDEWASPPDADGLRGLAAGAPMHGGPVRGVIESMNGARLVHDRLEECGWDVLIADAIEDLDAPRPAPGTVLPPAPLDGPDRPAPVAVPPSATTPSTIRPPRLPASLHRSGAACRRMFM